MALRDIGNVFAVMLTAVFALAVGFFLIITLAPSVGQTSGLLVEALFVFGSLGMIVAVVFAYVLGRR